MIMPSLKCISNSIPTQVQIMKNKISATCLDILCTEGMGSNKLRNVQLDCNPIGADGAVILARALTAKTTLFCCLSSLRLGYAQLAASGLYFTFIGLEIEFLCAWNKETWTKNFK